MASASSVAPHRLRICAGAVSWARLAISSATARSLGEPNSQIAKPSAARRPASSAKCAAGQRLAGPYSAPGQKAAILAGRSIASRVRVFCCSATVDRSRGAETGRGSGAPGSFRQLREAFDHQRQGGFVEAVAAVEQAVTRFAGESDALRNPGESRNQRRFQGVGQDVGGVIAARGKLASETPAFAQAQRTVAEWVVEHMVDFAHAPQYGGHPRRCQGIQGQVGVLRVQPGKQRLRHDRVANPGRGDDEGFHLDSGFRIED